MTGFHVTRGRANCFDYDRLERMAKRFCINHNLLDEVEPNYNSMKQYIKDNDLYPAILGAIVPDIPLVIYLFLLRTLPFIMVKINWISFYKKKKQ